MGSSGLTRVLSLSIILCFPLSDLLSGLDLSPSGFISASPDLPHFLALPSPHDHLLLRDSDGKGKRKSKKRKKKKKKNPLGRKIPGLSQSLSLSTLTGSHSDEKERNRKKSCEELAHRKKGRCENYRQVAGQFIDLEQLEIQVPLNKVKSFNLS
jgi:hypothetical protein